MVNARLTSPHETTAGRAVNPVERRHFAQTFLCVYNLLWCVAPGRHPWPVRPKPVPERSERPQMFDNLFGAEGSLIVRFVVAFVIVLGLIALTFWLIRRFGGTRVGTAAARGRAPRLAVVDAAPVDGRRRLVLVRRDNVEHLLMIGGPTDIVVEENILRAVPVTPPRDVPVPRTPGAVEAASATRPPPDEWAQEPSPRQQSELPRPSFPRPDPLPRPRPPLDALSRATEALARSGEPLGRPTLPPSLNPRPSEPPLVPTGEPDADRPGPPSADAALANMAQRLEA